MQRCTRWRRAEREAGGGFDEDRASERASEPREGGYIPRRRKERQLERGTVTREERRTCRYERKRETRGGTSDERRAREETERESTGTGRTWASERKEKPGDEKERRYARKERRNDIERERKREAAREGESGRTRERRRASAWPAEGARRPHMCSETNVRSECRLLPIIRCRGVPLCARGWSADSVPRFYAARQPGPVRRARLSAKTAR